MIGSEERASAVYSVGRRIPGALMPLGPVALSIGETEKGKFYELHIYTDGIPDPRRTIEGLIDGLRDHGVETIWARSDAESIQIQIAGSPIAWATLLLLLPTILSVLGVVVTLIAVYMIFSGIPSWSWGLLAVGLLLLAVLPKIIKIPDERYR